MKKIQSEIRCAIHIPNDSQLSNDEFSEEAQNSGLKIEPEELSAQIAYELGSVYFLQFKYTDAQNMFSTVRKEIEKIEASGEEPLFLSVNKKKFFGYEMATNAILKQRAGEQVNYLNSLNSRYSEFLWGQISKISEIVVNLIFVTFFGNFEALLTLTGLETNLFKILSEGLR